MAAAEGVGVGRRRAVAFEVRDGAAMVAGQVVVENALSMLLVFDDDVVEAVPAQGTDHPLAERIGRWRARRCGEESGAESSDAAMEVGAIDRVSVVDEESRDLVASLVASAMRWAAQRAVGCSVTPAWTMVRRPRERTTKT